MGFKTLKYSYYLLSTSEYFIMIFQIKPPFFQFELKLLSPNPCSPKSSIPYTHTLNLNLSNGGGRGDVRFNGAKWKTLCLKSLNKRSKSFPTM